MVKVFHLKPEEKRIVIQAVGCILQSFFFYLWSHSGYVKNPNRKLHSLSLPTNSSIHVRVHGMWWEAGGFPIIFTGDLKLAYFTQLEFHFWTALSHPLRRKSICRAKMVLEHLPCMSEALGSIPKTT